jgi:four helix bundle protein
MFISKLADSEGEAAETHIWLEFAAKCHYMAREEAAELCQLYREIISTVVGMINHPETWVLRKRSGMTR